MQDLVEWTNAALNAEEFHPLLVIGIFIVCTICVMAAGCGKGFDASGYTEAILALQFQGDVRNAGAFVEGTDRAELMEMYQ